MKGRDWSHNKIIVVNNKLSLISASIIIIQAWLHVRQNTILVAKNVPEPSNYRSSMKNIRKCICWKNSMCVAFVALCMEQPRGWKDTWNLLTENKLQQTTTTTTAAARTTTTMQLLLWTIITTVGMTPTTITILRTWPTNLQQFDPRCHHHLQ